MWENNPNLMFPMRGAKDNDKFVLLIVLMEETMSSQDVTGTTANS